ncbi:MAG TPA: DUF2993 domain-containing protein [Limnochordia bacterium]
MREGGRAVNVRRAWRYVAVAVVLLGGVVGSQYLLPPFFAKQLERALARSSGAPKLVSVRLRALPAVGLIAGYVPALSIDIRGAQFGDMRVAAFLFDGHGLFVDAFRLWRGEGFALRHAERFNVTLALREADLNAYLWEKIDPDRQFRVQVDKEGIHLAGRVSVLGFGVDVRVAGRLVVRDGTKIAFEPDDVSLGQTRLPAFLQRVLADRWGLLIDLSRAPVPLEIADVRTDKGMLFVYAHKPDGREAAG